MKQHYYAFKPQPAAFGGHDSQDFKDALVWYWHAMENRNFAEISDLFKEKWGYTAEGNHTAVRIRYLSLIYRLAERDGSEEDDAEKQQRIRRKAAAKARKPRKARINQKEGCEMIYKWRTEDGMEWEDIRKKLVDDYDWQISEETVRAHFNRQRYIVQAAEKLMADSANSVAKSAPTDTKSNPSFTDAPADEADDVDT
jgi:hypothetical protein